MSKFRKDQRVVVDVRDQAKWNKDVLGVLQGKSGSVLTVKTVHDNGHEKVALDPPLYLVVFDEPTRPTSRGVTHSGYWFDENEIRGQAEVAR